MDASLLTRTEFWKDPAPFTAGRFPEAIPDLPELRGHVLFETSGSTGSPKWIALSKEALLASAVAVNDHLGITQSSRWGLPLPAHHVGGFGVAARAFAAGCGFHEFGKRWDPSACRDWLDEKQVTHTSMVPTQVHDLVTAGLPSPASLQAIVVGGGHLDAKTGQAARALGWPVLASYGMTEAGSQIATQSPSSLTRIYLPTPIPLLPIWRAETLPDQTLRISGAALFSGTLVKQNEEWFFEARESAWHQTQDRVELADGFLTPLGRADHRIKVLGELLDPEEIEGELLSLSAGRLKPGSFAVIAIPDDRAEHSLLPVFDGALDERIIASVLKSYAEQAPGFRRLAAPVMMDDFPRSGLGKPRRAEIKARCVSHGGAGPDSASPA